MGMGQNLVPLVNTNLAGIYGCSFPLKMVFIGIDPWPHHQFMVRPLPRAASAAPVAAR